jgi:hypothetical protein
LLRFKIKRKARLEDFCRDFYDNIILNPKGGGVHADDSYPEVMKKLMSETCPAFASIDVLKLKEALTTLRFALFTLAMTHKYESKHSNAQYVFTKLYLHEKGRDDVWNGLESYNKIVCSIALRWLYELGEIKKQFWSGKVNDAAEENTGGKNNIVAIDDFNENDNSSHPGKQIVLMGPLVITFCSQIDIDPSGLNEETAFRLAASIRGLYEGIYELINEVKIV